MYVVLTFDQRKAKSQEELYRDGLQRWAKLRKRFNHHWGGFRYIQTWERHKSGYPHVNILIGNPFFYSAAVRNRRGLRKKWLERNAVQCGFGRRTWLEPLRNEEAMAGYLVKSARELTGAGPKNQIPTNAPKHFRRLRASRGLLPPPHKNPDITGVLLFGPIGGFLPQAPPK